MRPGCGGPGAANFWERDVSNLLSPEPWRKQQRPKIEPPVTIRDVSAVRGTPKALLCVWAGAEHWIARSQIAAGSEVRKPCDSGVLIIPAWLAAKMTERPPERAAPPAVETVTLIDQHGQIIISFIQAHAEVVCPVCQAAREVRLEGTYGDAVEGVVVHFRCDSGGHAFGLRFIASESATALVREDAEDGGAGNGVDTF